MDTKRWFGRKFWVALAAILGFIAAAMGGEITWTVAIQSIMGAVAAYVIGTGIESAGEAKAVAIIASAAQKTSETAKKTLPALLVGLLMCGFLAPMAQCATLEALPLAAVQSTGTTDLSDAVNSTFAATVFWDNNTFKIAPGGKDLWRSGKLHTTAFALITPVDRVQIGVATAIGYDIDVSKPFRQLFKRDKLLVVITPYYGLSQDITVNGEDRLITKPYPGLSATVRW